MITNGAFILLALSSHFLAIVMALRLLMRAVYVSPHAPLAPFIITVSKPFVKLIGLITPQMTRFDVQAFFWLYAFLLIELFAKAQGNLDTSLINLLIFTLLNSLSLLINVLFFAILIRAMMSWFSPETHPVTSQLLIPLTHWIESPIRRYLPSTNTIDLTPMIAILILKAIEFMLMQPLASILLS